MFMNSRMGLNGADRLRILLVRSIESDMQKVRTHLRFVALLKNPADVARLDGNGE